MNKLISNHLRSLPFIILLIIPCVARLQVPEFEKSLEIKCTSSIVREWSYQKWVIYSYKVTNSLFAMIPETGSTAQTLNLPNNYVITDFEIYNDIAYFCGYVDSTTTIALFGFFNLSSFPSTTVYCCRVVGLKRLNKLAVFNDHNKPHIVFTGSTTTLHSVLVDAIETSPNFWSFDMANCTNIENLIYDDVAVTDNYIVATSRNSFVESGQIHYFKKPTSISSIFPSFYLYSTIEYNTVSPILLTACSEDCFATLCNNSPLTFVMNKYAGLNNDISLEGNAFLSNCIDINFNNNSKNIEVLILARNKLQHNSLTIQYDDTLIGSSFIPIHIFENRILNSIDYLFYQPDLFIASGNEPNEEPLHLFRYKYNDWFNCTENDILYVNKINNNLRYFDYTYISMKTLEETKPIECISREVPIYNHCNY